MGNDADSRNQDRLTCRGPSLTDSTKQEGKYSIDEECIERLWEQPERSPETYVRKDEEARKDTGGMKRKKKKSVKGQRIEWSNRRLNK
mmetsp:Transcript_10940/g.14245  ORF Transcript_10940/g.14245 Transcript_10940/m.14245 type:complete len:88 (-) Transcript_10940:2127-2390(-)